MKQDPSLPTPLAAAVRPADAFGRLLLRSALGGSLMGLANLVPGISGGTMLLAAGIYPRFIAAIAELTRLRFRAGSVLVLGTVAAAAAVAILLLAGVVRDLVIQQRWAMYSLFIGLTLGGLPIVWRMVGRPRPSVWLGAAVGLSVMAAVALLQQQGVGVETDPRAGWLLLLLGGVAAASAMILPGVSGGYLLLVMGLYVPLLSAIDTFRLALRARDLSAALEPALEVLVPVGIGVVVGIVAVSNLIRWLLARFETPTLGTLLGLLMGAVVGLWPFQQGVRPHAGQIVKGRVMTPELIQTLAPKDYPTAFFTPTAAQVAGALGLIVLGFLITALVARLGKEK